MKGTAGLGIGLVIALVACGAGDEGARAGGDALARKAAGLAAPTANAASTPSDPCVLARTPLRLGDGSEVYVEPEELLRLEDDLLVVGTPTYTWTQSAGRVTPRTSDAHLAAAFDLDGTTRMVEKPIAGSIGSVRAVALGGRRWGAVFDEIDPDSLPSRHHRLAFWYAEHDGERWTSVERLPEPAAGELDLDSDSELVRAGGDTLVWVVPARLPLARSMLVHYERAGGRWRNEVFSDDWAEIVTLALDSVSRDLWMAQVSEDAGLPGWQQTLRLHRRVGGTWELVSRIAEEPAGRTLRDPRVIVHRGGLAISWWLLGAPPMPAQARIGVQVGRDGITLTLDASVAQVIPIADATSAEPMWLVSHLVPNTPISELRVLRSSPGPLTSSVSVLVSTPNPYPSFFAAIDAASEIVVIGPEPSLDPMRSPVRSLILRLSTSCT